MRGAAVLLSFLALAACGDRRSFDERYGDTANEIEQRAQRLDAEMNQARTANQSERSGNSL